jgi:hypothetical protein
MRVINLTLKSITIRSPSDGDTVTIPVGVTVTIDDKYASAIPSTIRVVGTPAPAPASPTVNPNANVTLKEVLQIWQAATLGSGSMAHNVAIGSGVLAANTTGDYNTAVGFNCLHANTTGTGNSGYGYNALAACVSGVNGSAFGHGALALATANNNSAFGHSSLSLVVGGHDNSAFGYSSGATLTSGFGNVLIGAATGGGLQTGSNNTIVGAGVTGLATGLTGAIILATGDGVIRIDYNKSMSGGWSVAGGVAHTPPSTKTINYTVLDSDYSLIFNGGASITVTLPNAANYPGRILKMKNVAAFAVVSASSNVVPLAGGAPGTAILAAAAGKFAELQSDGTNWIIMMAN